MRAFFVCGSAGLPRAVILLACALGLTGCASPEASISFSTGQLAFMVRSSDLSLPEELRDGSNVRELACGPMGFCPSAGRVMVVCEGGICDPSPTAVEIPVGSVFDFDEASSELESFFAELTAVRITSATYDVQANTLTVALPATDVYWGPEGATGLGSPGVTRLGTIPEVAAGGLGSGEVALDAGGADALSDFLVGTARRVRFFARTTVDLEPGGPFPAGDLTVALELVVRAEGKVID